MWGASEAPNSWCLTITSHDSWLAFCDSRFMSSCVWWLRSCSSIIVTKISSIGNMVSCHQVSTEAPLGQRPPHFCTSLGHSHWALLTNVSDLLGIWIIASCWYQAILGFWGGHFAPHVLAVSLCRWRIGFKMIMIIYIYYIYIFGPTVLLKIVHNPGIFDSLTTKNPPKKSSWPSTKCERAQASNAFGLKL